MKTVLLAVICFLGIDHACAQNVGIGNPNPQEKLDVTGNINLTGTIKANGVAGQSGQVLRTGTTGNLEWGNVSGYQYFASFNTAGAFSWTVPAGVTKVLVEVYGPGGGGSQHGSGGGGGYGRAWFDVTPGNSITGVVGTGGSGGTVAGVDGINTTATVGGYQLVATSGYGSAYVNFSQYLLPAGGGSFGVSPAYANSLGQQGASGSPNKISYTQASSTIYMEIVEGAKGGDGANTVNTGGTGGYRVYNLTASTVANRANPSWGSQPGGGGGGGNATVAGAAGAHGKVVIWY